MGSQYPGDARAQRQLAPLWVGYQHGLSLGHWVDGFWRRELRLRRHQNPHRVGQHRRLVGFGVYADSDLLTTTANISGYPGDKPAGTQWYHARKVTSVNARKVYYDIDTAGGQSGSAVYRIVNGGRYGIAIHAYGGATANSGTRIVQDVFNNLIAWKA